MLLQQDANSYPLRLAGMQMEMFAVVGEAKAGAGVMAFVNAVKCNSASSVQFKSVFGGGSSGACHIQHSQVSRIYNSSIAPENFEAAAQFEGTSFL